MQLEWFLRNLGTGPIPTYLVRFTETAIEVYPAPEEAPQVSGWTLGANRIGVVDGVLEVFAAPPVRNFVGFPIYASLVVTEQMVEYFGLFPPAGHPGALQFDWYVRNLGSGPTATYRVHLGATDLTIFTADPTPPEIDGWNLGPDQLVVIDGTLQAFPAPWDPIAVPMPALPPRINATITDGVLDYFGFYPLIPVTPPMPPFSGAGGGEWPQGDFRIVSHNTQPDSWLGDELSASDFWLEAQKATSRGKRLFKQRKGIRGS